MSITEAVRNAIGGLVRAMIPINSDGEELFQDGAIPVSGPLTDAELRATAVPVSGPLTDTQLRATAVPVSGTVTASGPLTDTQLRATAVPVSGPLTDTQIRATALPVAANPVPSQVVAETVTILDTESLSGALEIAGVGVPVALHLDEDWDTEDITFEVSYDGTNFFDLVVDGAEYEISAAAAEGFYVLDPSVFIMATHIKVRSGVLALPVAQNGDTVITVIMRPIY